jgi:hypothetical protein
VTWSRRDFVRRASALTALGLGIGCSEEEAPPASSPGSGPWGAPSDATQAAALLPAARVPEGVLELFLWGGVNAFDTFHVIPEHGVPKPQRPGQGWWAFQEGPDSIPDVFARCGGGDRALLEPWRRDEAGRQVHLGPFIYPLRERPDILARTRSIVLRHDAAPHQVAVPLALGGHVNGNPRLAGFGAHVERFFQARAGLRDAPYAWVLFPDMEDTSTHNTNAAVAVGAHDAAARPMALTLGEQNRVVELLARSNLGGRSREVDAALAHYLSRYRESLVGPDGAVTRSPAVGGYEAAISGLARADRLRDLLPAELLAVEAGESCGNASDLDLSSAQLRLATHLLTRANEPARYACVIDGGLLPATTGAAYDTHMNHVVESSRNLVHTFERLTALINEPGEDDPDKLDLDRHQILITTEFGRSPQIQNGTGLNHWPWGYVQFVIGGWADEERSGILGSIPESGYADASISPSEFRAAMLLGMGIWPFNSQAFAVGDTRIDGTETDAAWWLREHVLGYPA